MDDVIAAGALERVRAAIAEIVGATANKNIVAEAADEHLVGSGASQSVVARGPEVGHRAGDIAAIDHVRAVAADQHIGEAIAIDVRGTDVMSGAVVRSRAGDGESLVFPERPDVDVAMSAFLAEDDIGLAGSIPVRHVKPRRAEHQIVDAVAIDVAGRMDDCGQVVPSGRCISWNSSWNPCSSVIVVRSMSLRPPSLP